LIGANFQAITWAQSDGGYLNAGGSQPNKSLADALHHMDQKLGQVIQHLTSIGKMNSTLLILGSKQGQDPIDPKTLNEFDQSVVVAGAKVPVAFFTGDDGGIMWLQNQSQAQEAKTNQLANSSLGIQSVLAGDEVQLAGYGSPSLDSRVPDLVINAKVGTLWAHSYRFEDHGGFLPQDFNVPLLTYNPNLAPKNITGIVSNRQVATTLLQALGLPLSQLDGYRNEGTPSLPFLFK
jgi:arylsulfatase A-like enzyme